MEKVLDIYKNSIKELIKSPGKGAERAVAIITSLSTVEEIPWDRIAKFKVDWNDINGEFFPKIDIEFHDSTAKIEC